MTDKKEYRAIEQDGLYVIYLRDGNKEWQISDEFSNLTFNSKEQAYIAFYDFHSQANTNIPISIDGYTMEELNSLHKEQSISNEYMNSHWEFIWQDNPKPKLSNDENIKLLPKQWKISLENMIELKSMIGILEENELDSALIRHKDTGEEKEISLGYLQNDYQSRLSNLDRLENSEDNEAEFARSIRFLLQSYDYKANGIVCKNNYSFQNAMLGTASQISLEKTLESINPNYEQVINEENKENLNYFGKKILEQKQKPQSKDEFINDLKNHCKSNIQPSEIIILVKMYHLAKPPSLLNNEHKKLIKESLGIANAYEKTNELDSAMKKEIDNIINSKERAKTATKTNDNSRGM